MLAHVAVLLSADLEGSEWSGRATWLTSRHESQALAMVMPEGQHQEGCVLPLDVTIGFKPSEAAGHSSGSKAKHRNGSRRQQMVLSTTMGVKVVTR